MNPLLFLLIIPAIVLIGIIAAASLKIRKLARRKRLLVKGLSDYEKSILREHVPIYRAMPEELRLQLHGLINVFLAEKRFIGCNGQEITDVIRFTTAAWACMLLLNRKTSYYGRLKTIYVYPDAYIAKRAESDGILVVEGKSIRLGESWQHGPVVLAWNSVAQCARNISDGSNVVLHEFAHQLDQEDGLSDGTPILNKSSYKTWVRVFESEFRRLGKLKHEVLDDYAFESPAEFFAVATETFFEKPAHLHSLAPRLYLTLKDYYKVSPIDWSI